MKKILSILLAILMLCGCGMFYPDFDDYYNDYLDDYNFDYPEVTEDYPEIYEPEPEPQQEEVYYYDYPQLVYGQFLTSELSSAPAYRMAMELPSVVSLNGEPLTDIKAAEKFIEAYNRGQYAEVYFYNFSDAFGSKNLSYRHLTSTGGVIYSSANYWFDWNNNAENQSKGTYYGIGITSDGYLYLVDSAGKTDNLSYTVKLKRDNFTSPEQSTSSQPQITPAPESSSKPEYTAPVDYNALRKKYIDPIFTITVAPVAFNSAKDLYGNYLWLFEDIYFEEKGYTPWQQYGDYWPVSDMVALLGRYFDGITREMIISENSRNYDSSRDAICYFGGRGGVYPEIIVTDYSQSGDYITLRYILSNSTGSMVDTSKEMVLTIRLLSNGTFRYVSQRIE